MSTQNDPQKHRQQNRLLTRMYRMSKLMILVQAALSEEAGQTAQADYYEGLDESLNMALQIMHAAGRIDYEMVPRSWWEADCITEALALMEAVERVYDEADLSHAFGD